ncbi:undecaprenyl/decaprenyl-phosphate alpha-N-acetylglucosaminyl 1-phosphate transferase [Synechococcus sp. CS-1325]|uniref:MraY family glycosyltransferase n=1 Tax=unclassified Synechococcus TaxID=2626047 RepID=UPI000DB01371|nr:MULTISPECIES: MraY family glycosyltransferase [unclassified Synechococcus]MCT0200185.1 undecaprenyl/decaprenyl-phosphate alpha-N-acetylglucosaminyl 1-phosphate transferase [Synechococcus sp. CS-1325]MCT0212726.1 undecaprenyl/decaprenyl-phosphate alpha-N-acetylglucosaminyl 1-phosphate transferase [Synechococcus sp. CS-1326]MCT0233734.1 undecaprenyl/decaprenyl-phosphate alpha-N-acetylglucosaminyl 1-phosphate transferase [Synechococcus sp. CS-1327]PZV01302.1 MAG: undecaprenyl-phosphate alpha-N-
MVSPADLFSSPLKVAVVTFGIAALLTALIVPLVRKLGLRYGLIDPPDPRKQHDVPMVRLGGVGMVAGFSLALAIIWALGGFGNLEPAKDQLIWTTLAGALCFFVIGLADDLFALPPLPRLAGQVAVAMAVWSQGVRIGAIDLPFGLFGQPPASLVLPDWLSLLATLIWLVGITNAINWIDGLDGLAAGVGGIAAIGLLSVSFSLQQSAAGLLAAALAGACFGFLRHNFNPARIFMGDGGSYFLGFTLAAISIVGPAKGLTTVSLLFPVLILSLPLADMSAVIMGRLSEGHSPFYPDRRHLHHRLLRAGFSHRRTVLLIYAFTQWLAALALVAANVEMRFLWLALATAVLIGAVTGSRRRHGREREAAACLLAGERGSAAPIDHPQP